MLDLHIKPKIVKYIEENIGENVCIRAQQIS